MREVILTDDIILLGPFRLEWAEQQVAGDDEENQKWLSGGVSTLETTRQWILKNQRSWKNDGPIYNFAILLKDTDTLIGMIEANSDPEAVEGLETGEINISYNIYPQYRRKGFATRAVNLITEFLREKGFQKAIIRVQPENKKSAGVPQRAGFREATRKQHKDGKIFIHFHKKLT